jgi:hypothetical protein
MSTKTKTTILDELAERENAAAEAKTTEREAFREMDAERAYLKALHDERDRLVARDPELVDHRGAGVDEDGPIAAIDKKIAGARDLKDLIARHDHALRITGAKRQSLEDWRRHHAADLRQALLPLAVDLHAEANSALDRAREMADKYVGFSQRFEQLTGERTASLDSASGTRQLLESVAFPEVA